VSGRDQEWLDEMADADRHERLSRAATEAMEEFGEAAASLAGATVEGRTRDGWVVVKVDATGEIHQLTLRPEALARYSSAALGTVVTHTLRTAQLRAREAYERAVADLPEPPEIAESDRLLRRAQQE
jgi:DNA-binding protein YbaB